MESQSYLNEKVFSFLYKESFNHVKNAVIKIVKNQVIASDITSDAFYKLWKMRSLFVTYDKARGYLFITALNKARNEKRNWGTAIRYANKVHERDNEIEYITHVSMDEKIGYTCITEALGRLTKKRKGLIHDFYYRDMSHQQIADKLKISPNTVKEQKAKAIQQLRKILTPVAQNININHETAILYKPYHPFGWALYGTECRDL